MKKMNKKGFTLIELLVVIAIIGLLSTMAVISLNSARQKSRDAKRLSDVKQMATVLSLAGSELPDATLRCNAIGTLCADGDLTTNVVGAQVGAGSTVSDPDLAVEFDKFTDPSQSATACDQVAAGAQENGCAYAFEVTAAAADNDLGSIQILFMTEAAAGTLSAKTVHSINSEGIITDLAVAF